MSPYKLSGKSLDYPALQALTLTVCFKQFNAMSMWLHLRGQIADMDFMPMYIRTREGC